jgi:hypothetical protein
MVGNVELVLVTAQTIRTIELVVRTLQASFCLIE